MINRKLQISIGFVERRIYLIRGRKVMLSQDLAELYEVEPRTLVQAVKRNKERFPTDFMFQLSTREHQILKSQTVISSWGGIRTAPYAFTQEGVAMISSILKSNRSIEVNIAIMRAFVKLREILLSNEELNKKISKLESKYDGQFQAIFKVIKRIIAAPKSKRKRIGFDTERDK